jgi:hypothetical protein
MPRSDQVGAHPTRADACDPIRKWFVATTRPDSIRALHDLNLTRRPGAAAARPMRAFAGRITTRRRTANRTSTRTCGRTRDCARYGAPSRPSSSPAVRRRPSRTLHVGRAQLRLPARTGPRLRWTAPELVVAGDGVDSHRCPSSRVAVADMLALIRGRAVGRRRFPGRALRLCVSQRCRSTGLRDRLRRHDIGEIEREDGAEQVGVKVGDPDRYVVELACEPRIARA